MFFTGHKQNVGQFSRDNTETLVGDYVENTKKLSKRRWQQIWNDVGPWLKMRLWRVFRAWMNNAVLFMSQAAHLHQMKSSANMGLNHRHSFKFSQFLCLAFYRISTIAIFSNFFLAKISALFFLLYYQPFS